MLSPFRSRLWAFVLALAVLSCPAYADEAAPPRKAEEQAASRGLPAEISTSHTVTIDGEKIAFTARAGAIRLRDASSDAPQADVAYVSYERTASDPLTRPVLFIFNGGPGAASAWLGLGAAGPWRLRISPETMSPSAAPVTVDNAETWLPFADLVLIDPPGTGYSKILSDSDDVRKRFYSVQGDAEALAVVLRKWLLAHGRLASPKFIAGESYGGFRAVKLARALRERESVGVNGLALVSPALDFAWLGAERNMLAYAGRLPSLAAAARGATDRAALADVEAYAAGEYVTDLLKGARDAEALSRLSGNVARFTGLDARLAAQLGGRIDAKTFTRERRRNAQEVLSAYDAGIVAYDPAPFAPESEWADPVLDAWRAPLGAAMTRLTVEKLGWPIGDARYNVLNDQIAHQWDYGRQGRANAEAVSDLRDALALDPQLRVLVAHGVADLVTPYFATKLMLDQLPAFGGGERVSLTVLAGGHMPYLYDAARRELRDAVRRLVEKK
ncbi:MAG: peptidase S10 [Methylocystis sp.]|nr:MAG: peptidase S10 [Methylocystis sp.]